MMYAIATKLTKPIDDPSYEGFVLAIKALGPWSDRLDSTWLVESPLHAGQIRTLLKAHVAPEDRLFVCQFTGNWAGYNMGRRFPEWIGRRSFQRPTVSKA